MVKKVAKIQKGTYYCPTCEAKGDLLYFVMKREGWTYFKTYHMLTDRLKGQERSIVYVLKLEHGCYSSAIPLTSLTA